MTPQVQIVVIMVRFPRPWEEANKIQLPYGLACREFKARKTSCQLAYLESDGKPYEFNGRLYAYLWCDTGTENDAVDWACGQLKQVLSDNTKIILIIRHGGNLSAGNEWERHSYSYVRRGEGGVDDENINGQEIWNEYQKFRESLKNSPTRDRGRDARSR